MGLSPPPQEQGKGIHGRLHTGKLLLSPRWLRAQATARALGFARCLPVAAWGPKKLRSLSRQRGWKDVSGAGMGFPVLCSLRV